MKKGIYTILTTFFFIIMILIVALGIVYYGSAMANISNLVDTNLGKFVTARNVRDSLYYCYGKVLDEEYLDKEVCKGSNKSVQITGGLIKGYRIRKLGMNNCTPRNWSNVDITSIEGIYRDRFIYASPILENKTYVCLGLIEVYI